jgi:tetratricopeptide (TPR) repeat protein
LHNITKATTKYMNTHFWSKRIVLCLLAVWTCGTCFASESLYRQARNLQREGKFDDAIATFQNILTQPVNEKDFDEQQYTLHTEALMQLMNTFQSKGNPEACVIALRDVFKKSPVLQHLCLRDYYSVLGYALSRTENMKEAEETTLKALTLPLNQATPERYFRDYAYAAAVFYSNPKYQNEVINWCEEALNQAVLCENTSGKQWVTAMLGTLYKRNGHLNKALTLFQQSKEEAERQGDNLGKLNSLHALVDLLLYWQAPEYADIYASEALQVEKSMTEKNPMVSAQTYINKGWVKHQLGEADSVAIYTERARQLCYPLPYNSGMADVNLLHGTYLTEQGGDSLQLGIQELQNVAQQATATNRAKAYHQLAQTYLRMHKSQQAEAMLDSMYALLNPGDVTTFIRIDYQPIIHHYLKTNQQKKVEQYTHSMLQERKIFKEKKLNYNLVESIVDAQTEQKRQELELLQLQKTNQLLIFLICITLALVALAVIVAFLLKQRKQHRIQMKHAEERFTSLVERLNQSNSEKEIRAQEIKEILKDKDNRQELETLTPTIFQTEGESKFRQCFELLYPTFLPRLRERVPTLTRREELLSMFIVLKQDNKRIAELLAIAPRSVLMLRHRFRQKIGMNSEFSLENFIEDMLMS